jgi:hypothetical protein
LLSESHWLIQSTACILQNQDSSQPHQNSGQLPYNLLKWFSSAVLYWLMHQLPVSAQAGKDRGFPVAV